MADEFDVTVDISTTLLKVNKLAGRFSNFKPLAGGRLANAVRNFLKRRFESEGKVGGGGRWVHLSPSYAAFKALRVGRGRKILDFSGVMRHAFTSRGDPHQVIESGPDFFVLTVDQSVMPRARSHQRGDPKKNLPARPIIPDPLPKTFLAELKQAVSSYVLKGET